MTQEEINDYNRRCAQFLGWKYENKIWLKPHPKEINIWIVASYSKTFVNFAYDWNWIMEVVEAIEKLKFRFEIALNEINLYCILEERRFSYAINYYDCENYGEEMHLTKKEAVVQAINQFLIWYNNESNKK